MDMKFAMGYLKYMYYQTEITEGMVCTQGHNEPPSVRVLELARFGGWSFRGLLNTWG